MYFELPCAQWRWLYPGVKLLTYYNFRNSNAEILLTEFTFYECLPWLGVCNVCPESVSCHNKADRFTQRRWFAFHLNASLPCKHYYILYTITVTSQWGRWRLKAATSWLFVQPFVQAEIKEIVKALRHWPLLGEYTGDRGPVTYVKENFRFGRYIPVPPNFSSIKSSQKCKICVRTSRTNLCHQIRKIQFPNL